MAIRAVIQLPGLSLFAKGKLSGQLFPLPLILEEESRYVIIGAKVIMSGFGNIVQKAFYLGVGLATYAGEKAGGTLAELRTQAQKLVDELVERGELTTEEARKLVDEMVQQAQQQPAKPTDKSPAAEPRRIEIISDDEEEASESSSNEQNVDTLRKQVEAMQEELRRLKRE